MEVKGKQSAGQRAKALFNNLKHQFGKDSSKEKLATSPKRASALQPSSPRGKAQPFDTVTLPLMISTVKVRALSASQPNGFARTVVNCRFCSRSSARRSPYIYRRR